MLKPTLWFAIFIALAQVVHAYSAPSLPFIAAPQPETCHSSDDDWVECVCRNGCLQERADAVKDYCVPGFNACVARAYALGGNGEECLPNYISCVEDQNTFYRYCVLGCRYP